MIKNREHFAKGNRLRMYLAPATRPMTSCITMTKGQWALLVGSPAVLSEELKTETRIDS